MATIKEAVVLVLFLCSTPSLAQSGIDSLGNGGSLGGDTPPVGTDIKRVDGDTPANSKGTDSQPEYYTLDGRRIPAPRRGELYIIRWREHGVWRESKHFFKQFYY